MRADLTAGHRSRGRQMRAAIRPGITETELWSIMFQSVLEQNGDYCETRLLNSGHRTPTKPPDGHRR